MMNFEDVYCTYQRQIYKYVLSRLWHPQLSDDVTQEVFLKAWRVWPPEIENIKSWLYAIAHHAVIDVARRQKIIMFDSIQAMQEEQRDLPMARDIEAEIVDCALYAGALKHLPLMTRFAIRLLCEGYTYEETAAFLHMTVPVVKMRVMRARKQMRKEVAA